MATLCRQKVETSEMAQDPKFQQHNTERVAVKGKIVQGKISTGSGSESCVVWALERHD